MARRLRSGIDLTSLQLRLERNQTLAPEGFHPLGLLRVGEPRVLERDGALCLALRVEPGDDPGLAVAPVEARRLRPRGGAFSQLVVGQPAPAPRLVHERVV